MPFTIPNLSNAIGAVKDTLNSGIDNFMSSIRSKNLLPNLKQQNPTASASPTFGNEADWRVRLSIPPGDPWTSELFKPLRNAGGLIFPYTPTITISHSANYNDQPITHQNYQFVAYQYSKVSDITIVGDFIIEDAEQAQYWLSALHFLRSVTKMYSGEDGALAGNPPPLLVFNAYGDYVFKNIPVVVKSFSVTLPKEVDYITTKINELPNPRLIESGGGPLDKLGGFAGLAAGVLGAAGQTKAANAITSLVNGTSVARGFGGSVKPGGTSSENDSHVPTQSSFTVTIMPVYSRTKVRQFSLSKFVQGGYVKEGYL
ncbi:hypothetical protein EBU71_16070 [bacterium]|nr:hypothetical protein [Candidatus Elulimicrobium humile]